MRKADERRRPAVHLAPAVRSRQLREEQKQAEKLLRDPGLEMFRLEVAALVEEIQKQPRLTKGNMVELPGGVFAHAAGGAGRKGYGIAKMGFEERFQDVKKWVETRPKTLALPFSATRLEPDALLRSGLKEVVGDGKEVKEQGLEEAKSAEDWQKAKGKVVELAMKAKSRQHVSKVVRLVEAVVEKGIWQVVPEEVALTLLRSSGRCGKLEL